MSEHGHVRIGPEFFAKIKYDYTDADWAWVREILQNSLDARSSEVTATVSVAGDDSTTTVVVRNNGEPMTRDVLCNKLLNLGGSGKNFSDGCTGGYGVAKSLIYYSQENYRIRTGTLLVEGRG